MQMALAAAVVVAAVAAAVVAAVAVAAVAAAVVAAVAVVVVAVVVAVVAVVVVALAVAVVVLLLVVAWVVGLQEETRSAKWKKWNQVREPAPYFFAPRTFQICLLPLFSPCYPPCRVRGV